MDGRKAVAEPSDRNGEGFLQFPTGLRVLVVDDDAVCLSMLDALLKKCGYAVTVAQHAVEALKLLRAEEKKYDIVITDVQMPDVDGFKLLEIINLELDIPVIMLSSNNDISMAMKGIKHGACDYLLKPVRLQELEIIWKHVIKKSLKDLKKIFNPNDKIDHVVRNEGEENEDEDNNIVSDAETSTEKKPRMTWSIGLQRRFEYALKCLGKRAGPKKILEIMNVPGVTRHNVASHLQKFRKNMEKGVTGMNQTYHDGLGSSYFRRPTLRSRFIPINDQGSCSKFHEDFKVTRYQSHTGGVLFNHGQHHSNSHSHVDIPSSQLPPQPTLAAQVGQTRTMRCEYGPNSLVLVCQESSEPNGLSYGPPASRPNQLQTYMGNSFAQHGYSLCQQNPNILIDNANVQADVIKSGISIELNGAHSMLYENNIFGMFTREDLDTGAQTNEDLSLFQDGTCNGFLPEIE